MNRYDQFAETLTSEDGISYESGLPFMDFLYSGRVQYYKVSESEENRPDLIAWKFFGDPTLWYPILLYNNWKDPLSLPSGTILAIPIDAATQQNQYQPFTYE